jgi:pimeloyl-ACP methyl ester carboxylesterase
MSGTGGERGANDAANDASKRASEGAPGSIESAFVAANGLRFHLETCAPPSGGAGAPLALCLHGFPECSFSWRHQLPLLASLGYRAWAPDLRGYGETDRPPGVEAYDVEHLLDDVSGLLDAAGVEKALLLGHDWGALVAWLFAMRRPERVERLVILNVPHPACAERELRRPRQLLRSWYVLFFQLPWLPEKLLARAGIGKVMRDSAVHEERFDASVREVYDRNAAGPGALTAMLSYYRAALRGGGMRRQRALGFPVIDAPTLMVWGEQDVALTKETTYGTDRYVSDLTLRYLPDASHWVQQDAPEEVNAILEAWLTGKPVPEFAE